MHGWWLIETWICLECAKVTLWETNVFLRHQRMSSHFEIWFHTQCHVVTDVIGVTVMYLLIDLPVKLSAGKTVQCCLFCCTESTAMSRTVKKKKKKPIYKNFCTFVPPIKKCNSKIFPYDCVQKAYGITNIYAWYTVCKIQTFLSNTACCWKSVFTMTWSWWCAFKSYWYQWALQTNRRSV